MKKTQILLMALAGLISLTQAQAAPTALKTIGSSKTIVGYQTGEVGANHRVWQKVVRVTDQRGNPTLQTNLAYVELAGGLNYWDGNQWQESKEIIEPFSDGAIARYGQHKVIFANNLNTVGAIDLQTPDGKELRSHVLGLSYFDSSSGKSVLIAQAKDCQGQIANGNQVIYADAFDGVSADVRYTYKRGSFEQDVILAESPLPPEKFGLASASTVLQVLTEFDAVPEPKVVNRSGDEWLDFGAMKMARGKAFAAGQSRLDGVRVSKQWQQVEGRTILVESVPVSAIADELKQLASVGTPRRGVRVVVAARQPYQLVGRASPRAGIAKRHGSSGASPHQNKDSLLNVVSTQRRLPSAKPTAAVKTKMKLAMSGGASVPASRSSKGLVLDYVTVVGSTGDYTFQSDTTYYVTGEFIVGGALTVEGGTVIKYSESGDYEYGGIYPYAGFQCQTSPYRPAVITSASDNSVSQTISGGTGSPSRYPCSALDFDISTVFSGPVQYLHIRYAAMGLTFGSVTPAPVRHCQFINVGDGVQNYDSGTVTVENCLFSGVSGNVLGADGYPFSILFRAANLTVHHAKNLITTSTTLSVTNSLFICVTNWGGTFIGAFNATNSSDAGVFASGTFGNEYLAADSPYRNAGTTDIDLDLLADLRQTTTYTSLAGSYPDTDAPDLGFHYPIIRSTGIDFWMAFFDMGSDSSNPNVLSLQISSTTSATGTVSIPGVMTNGPILIVTNCGDATLNGTYILTNLSVQEQADWINLGYLDATDVGYVKGTNWVDFINNGDPTLFGYDGALHTFTYWYSKEDTDLNGGDWDSYDDPASPPTTICTEYPFSRTFSVTAETITNIGIPLKAMILRFDAIVTNAIHITASQPVSVYAMNYISAASAAFTCYPTTLLGTNYCLLARAPNFLDFGNSEFAVVATESNTTVTITPSANANLVGHYGAYTVNLQPGEIYQDESVSTVNVIESETFDVTGTWISSDKPVAVFAGDTGANVPDDGIGAANPLVQEQLPVDQWGTNALALSFAGRTGGDSYRILAATNDTVITVNGTIVATNDAGESFDTIIDGPVWFQATKPIEVAQFANGTEFDNMTNAQGRPYEGDPCEILLPPVGRWLETNIIVTLTNDVTNLITGDFDENFLNIIIPQSATNATFVDGSLVAMTNYTAIGTSGYYGAQITITNSGTHTVTSSQPVEVQVYGWGYYDAYGYFGSIVK